MALYSNNVMPPRPRMPTDGDEFRAQHQISRAQILRENFDDTLQAWLTNYVREEILNTWGQPDTSQNPLVAYCRQLTTPGRYFKRPKVTHQDQTSDGIVGPGGKLDVAGVFSKLQTVEYLNTGLGDYFVRLDVRDGQLVVRLVDPANIYIEQDPDTMETVLLWELRPRYMHPEDKLVWTWDAYYVGDKARGIDPYYRILSAERNQEGDYEDLSHRFLQSAENPDSYGALSGDEYPFVNKEGTPFLPWVHYVSSDTGEAWHWTDLRGLHRGTLHVCSYATYTGRAALDATGSHALAFGLEPPGLDVLQSSGPYDGGGASGAPIRQMNITPGTITFCETSGGVQPGVQIIGPGINLDSLHKFVRGYIHDLMAHRGIGGGMSVEKTGANPASGAALYISDRQKREYQERTEPLYRRKDLELVAKAAILCNISQGTDYPEDGYAIVYARPERSPQEMNDSRIAAEWAVTNGYASRGEIYMEQNPGIGYDEAVDQLVKISLEQGEIERRIADAAPERDPVEENSPEEIAPDDETEDAVPGTDLMVEEEAGEYDT